MLHVARSIVRGTAVTDDTRATDVTRTENFIVALAVENGNPLVHSVYLQSCDERTTSEGGRS